MYKKFQSNTQNSLFFCTETWEKTEKSLTFGKKTEIYIKIDNHSKKINLSKIVWTTSKTFYETLLRKSGPIYAYLYTTVSNQKVILIVLNVKVL